LRVPGLRVPGLRAPGLRARRLGAGDAGEKGEREKQAAHRRPAAERENLSALNAVGNEEVSKRQWTTDSGRPCSGCEDCGENGSLPSAVCGSDDFCTARRASFL